MKYMMLIAGDEERWAARGEDERRGLYERIGAWWNAEEAAGRILEGHELEPSATATTIRIDDQGRPTVTDGPFVEGKEMVGGYAILEVDDLDAALALASHWPVPGDALELRPIVQRDG
jgi:hypothetical protein